MVWCLTEEEETQCFAWYAGEIAKTLASTSPTKRFKSSPLGILGLFKHPDDFPNRRSRKGEILMLDSWEITDADPVWDFRVDVFEDLHAGRPVESESPHSKRV